MHLTTTAVTNVERGKNEQTPEAANCFVCSRHYDSFSWHSIYILEFSMTTIDNIMKLHNAASHAAVQYALLAQVSLRSERSMQALDDRNEANEALRTALTEALAPKLEQEPVAELGVSSFTWLKDRPPAGTKLYAAPQAAQPVREPLNEGEWPKHPSAYVNDRYMGYSKSDLDSYAMQVLAAHGIGENK